MGESPRACPQGCQQNLWAILPRSARDPQTSILFEFNNLVVGTPAAVVCGIQTPQVFCGENRSQIIGEAQLLALTAADNDRTLRDGTGLSGKVHAGRKGISVHYRFDEASRETPLGAWPRDTLDRIGAKFDETKLRVERGGDPAGQKRAVVEKVKLEQAQVEQEKRELAERERLSDWTARDKHAGEVVLSTDFSLKRYYDIEASMKIARRDGWGLREEDRARLLAGLRRTTFAVRCEDGRFRLQEQCGPWKPLTRGEITAEAVRLDLEHLRRWCSDQWQWVGVVVELLDDEGEPVGAVSDSLWGIESEADDYLREVAQDIADGLAAGLTREARERPYTRDDLIQYVTVIEAQAYLDCEHIDTLNARIKELEQQLAAMLSTGRA